MSGAMKRLKECEQMYTDLGLKVLEKRLGHGSHLVFTIEYRGFCMNHTVAMMNGQDRRARLNRISDLNRFKKLVNMAHAGENPPLPVGVRRV